MELLYKIITNLVIIFFKMIYREKYIESIKKWLWKDKIIVLKWARQVWKTTLLKYFEEYLNKNWKKTFFVFCDNLDNTFLKSPKYFIEYLKLKFDFENLDEKIYIFLDEFQYIKDSWLFLKNIFDKYKDKLQLIVSGSSSLEITKNTEFLTWRTITFYIDRLSFEEFFHFKTNILKKLNIDNFEELQNFYEIMKKDLEISFLEYLNYGWYPEVVLTKSDDEKKKIIKEIVKTYIEKDIALFMRIENIWIFNDFIKVLSSNIWELLNINELSNILNISIKTLNKYIDILEWTFVFSRIRPFFRNVRKELSKMPKIFIEDLSIKNYVLWDFNWVYNKIDIWQDVENFVYNELRKKIEKERIYFYRTISKSEIDFILERKYWFYDLLEVKYRKKVIIPSQFKKFEEKYGVWKKIIITKDICKKENNIFFIPACIFWLITL